MSSAYEGKTLEQMKRSRSAIIGVTTKVEVKIRPILDKEKEEITTVDLSYLRAVKKTVGKRLEDAGFLNGAVLNLFPDTDADMEKELEDAEEFETKLMRSL